MAAPADGGQPLITHSRLQMEDADDAGVLSPCQRVCGALFGRRRSTNGDQRTPAFAESILGYSSDSSASLSSSLGSSTASMPSGTFLEGQAATSTGSLGSASAAQKRVTIDTASRETVTKETVSLVDAVLRVKVIAAFNLANQSSAITGAILGDVSDPFVQVAVGDRTHRTITVENNLNPEWKDPPIFEYKLQPDDTCVNVQVFNRNKLPHLPNGELGAAQIPITALVPGEDVSARLPLRCSATGPEVIGQVEVELRLVLGGRRPLAKGDHVHVWSNTSKSWGDCTVEDVTDSDCTKKGADGKGYKVAAGSVFVRFTDLKRQKWLTPPTQASDLRKPYDWVVIDRGAELPHRAVRAGLTEKDGEVFVGRSFAGEAGKINLASEPGPRKMWNFWCHGQDQKSRYAEVLVLRIGFKASWQPITKGDGLPGGAVADKDRRTFVARNEKGEGGFLTHSVPEGGGAPVMDRICCHGDGVSAKGEILVIWECPRELEVEIISCQELQSPEYRIGDLLKKATGQNPLSPYVEVEFDKAVWQSAHQVAEHSTSTAGERGFTARFAERVYIEIKADDDLEALALKLRVKDKRQIPFVPDPLIGECAITLDREVLGTERCEELKRKSVHGTITFLVQELKLKDHKCQESLELLPRIKLTEIGCEGLRDKLHVQLPPSEVEGEHGNTISLCVEALTSDPGGTLLVVLGSHHPEPTFEWLDDGAFLDFSLGLVGNINRKREAFKALLRLSSTSEHQAEEWQLAHLQQFLATHSKTASSALAASAASKLDYLLSKKDSGKAKDTSTPEAEVAANIAKAAKQLVGQPKGGAIILSAHGTIRAAAANLSFSSCSPYRLPPAGANNKFDLRLSTAVSIAHWMTSGVVFVRGEDGDVYAVVPNATGGMPHAYHVSHPP